MGWKIWAVWAILLLLPLGCNTEGAIDRKIDNWKRKFSGEDFDVYYLHKEDGVSPWGKLSITFWLSQPSDIEKLKTQTPQQLDRFVKNIRAEFIDFIGSLNLEDDIKSKYLDFTTELELIRTYIKDFNKHNVVVMEINQYGKIRSRYYRLKYDDDALPAAKGNYEATAELRKQRDETYRYTLTIMNKNEVIPLYVYDISLVHKRTGALNYRELRKEDDYELITEPALVYPKQSEEFSMLVDNYYGKYGQLRSRFKIELGWWE